jgi:hypothetical protein
MTTLKVHNIESAPEAKTLLEGSQKIRNDSGLHGVLAGAPILDAYQHELFVNSSLMKKKQCGKPST